MDRASYNMEIIIQQVATEYSIVRVIESRRMRWAGHVARTGEEGCV